MSETRPGVWGRLMALLEGEVSADALEAYRRAGGAVHALLDRVEERRLDLSIQGRHPWELEPATQAQLLCAWNAFALQTLGDRILDADYRSSPPTVGFVPEVTAEQVLAFYGQVEGWLSRAHEAASNPSYRLDAALPADLPPWSEVEPCPSPHLEAMLAATESLRTHAESALAIFPAEAVPAERRPAVDRLRQLLAEANSKADYASRLCSPLTSQEVHEQAERHAKDAVERYYHLGQLLAMPELIDAYDRRTRRSPDPGRTDAEPLPGTRGFDPWCLTDRSTRADWQRDPAAREAIESLWAFDPDPRRTLAIQAQIDAAVARGDVDLATERTGERIGYFYCCPWAPIYVAKRPVTIGGRRLGPLQQFTFDVSAEKVLRGGEFTRRILTGAFNATDELDYCDPRAGGHDEEH